MRRIDIVEITSGLNALVGLALAGAPWLVGYLDDGFATGASVLVGILVATFALARAYGAYRLRWLSSLNTIGGAALIVASWSTLLSSDVARDVALIAGTAILVLSLVSSLASGARLSQRIPR